MRDRLRRLGLWTFLLVGLAVPGNASVFICNPGVLLEWGLRPRMYPCQGSSSHRIECELQQGFDWNCDVKSCD